jgi:hypothetical protein
MSTIKARIQRLEELQPSKVCMIALQYDDQSIDWNDCTYPDRAAFNDAFDKSGLEPPVIILNSYRNRHESQNQN